MKDPFLKRRKARSLSAQISNVEWQILQRQQSINVRGDSLIRKIRQQLTAPTSLLLSGGVGFLLGELTKRRAPKSCGNGDKSTAPATSPLITALNLIGTVRTLYMALPIAWMLKSYKQSTQSSERRYRQAGRSSVTTVGRDSR
ncbi:MAG: hypothetical protein Q8Q40_05240 [Methylococcaceae bacterium]|nr:hypothetical protein [Methylococcaceae bacterium]MDP3903359.1 hypothetical protein [Methylococcaceae bacterium]